MGSGPPGRALLVIINAHLPGTATATVSTSSSSSCLPVGGSCALCVSVLDDDDGDGDAEDEENDGVTRMFLPFPRPRPLGTAATFFLTALATFFPLGGIFTNLWNVVCSLSSVGMSSGADEHHIYTVRSRDHNTSNQYGKNTPAMRQASWPYAANTLWTPATR